MLVGFFIFAAIQMMAIEILGEYIGSLHTQVRNTPLVIEAERVNFKNEQYQSFSFFSRTTHSHCCVSFCMARPVQPRFPSLGTDAK